MVAAEKPGLNGPAFGGLVGSAQGFCHFLRTNCGTASAFYPAKAIAWVAMANGTEFNPTRFLNRMDRMFLKP